jgi:hypothetical protein
MKNLRKLVVTVIFTCVLALPAFAGETHCPPEAPPPPPGVTQGPGMPSIAPGDMGTPTAANSQTSFSELAACVLESILPLF